MPVKLTVNLPEETVRGLKQIAEQRGVSYTEALRQIVDNQRFLYKQVQEGGKVLIEAPKDKSLREVIFPEISSKVG